MQRVEYLHRLSTECYEWDLIKILGYEYKSRLRSPVEINHYYKYSKENWSYYSNTSYDFMTDRSVQKSMESKISRDLKLDSLNLKDFYYQGLFLPKDFSRNFILYLFFSTFLSSLFI